MPYVPKQYDSARAFLQSYNDNGNIPDPMDKMRCAAYALYDDFYWNRPETFTVTLKDSSDTEIYLPSTKMMVNATARFLAVDFDYNVSGGNADPVKNLLNDFWAREEMAKKIVISKKSWMTWGDFVWHVYANDNKPTGKRVSVMPINPASYFPIEDDDGRVIGCHIVDFIKDPREKGNKKSEKIVTRRQTYRKEDDGRVSTELTTWEVGKWDDRVTPKDELRKVSTIRPKALLPRGITEIPVFHMAHNPPPGSSWGTSLVSGIEYIINALNQSMTYADLTLVLQGLGVYTSTAGPPRDNMGRPQPYKLSPGNVIELGQDDEFSRVTGVTNMGPFTEHLDNLDVWARNGLGLPDMAAGQVDVAVAQSGIALALKMGPIIAENTDKQLEIKAKWDQIFYNLATEWFPVFENVEPGEGLKIETEFGDPMPINRESVVAEVLTLLGENLITIDEARKKLEPLGYEYVSGIKEKLLSEAKEKSESENPDPYADESASSANDLATELGRL